jgi:hypothetical protein
MKDNRPITISDLYPDMSAEKLQEAEANLRRYVEILWRIHQRLKAEGKPWPRFRGDLTARQGSSTI